MKKSIIYNELSSFSDETMTYNHVRCHHVNPERFTPETHDICEIIFLVEGDINYITEDRVYHVTPNTLILTRPGDRHYLKFNNTHTYDRYDTLFDARMLYKGLFEKIPENLHIINLGADSPLKQIFERMEFYCQHFEGKMLKNLLQHLVEEIIYNITLADNHFELDESNMVMRNDMLTKAIEYVSENLEMDFSLEEMCQSLYITKGYLYKIFHQQLYISPKKYIISKRLAKAQTLIRQKKKPTEIYSECGFSDYSSFYRNYRSFFGYAPSEELNIKKIRKIKV